VRPELAQLSALFVKAASMLSYFSLAYSILKQCDFPKNCHKSWAEWKHAHVLSKYRKIRIPMQSTLGYQYRHHIMKWCTTANRPIGANKDITLLPRTLLENFITLPYAPIAGTIPAELNNVIAFSTDN
jgi:hypothetical protein